jgi:hypothetical protein
MDTEHMQAAADRLGAKLDSLDLDTDERTVLEGVLGAGATSVSAGGEVEGFAAEQPAYGLVSLYLRRSGGNHWSVAQFTFNPVLITGHTISGGGDGVPDAPG